MRFQLIKRDTLEQCRYCHKDTPYIMLNRLHGKEVVCEQCQTEIVGAIGKERGE